MTDKANAEGAGRSRPDSQKVKWAFKGGFLAGKVLDTYLHISDGLAHKLFTATHSTDSRSKGHAEYVVGDKIYKGDYTPTTTHNLHLNGDLSAKNAFKVAKAFLETAVGGKPHGGLLDIRQDDAPRHQGGSDGHVKHSEQHTPASSHNGLVAKPEAQGHSRVPEHGGQHKLSPHSVFGATKGSADHSPGHGGVHGHSGHPSSHGGIHDHSRLHDHNPASLSGMAKGLIDHSSGHGGMHDHSGLHNHSPASLSGMAKGLIDHSSGHGGMHDHSGLHDHNPASLSGMAKGLIDHSSGHGGMHDHSGLHGHNSASLSEMAKGLHHGGADHHAGAGHAGGHHHGGAHH